jgi:hypothetical protein
VAGVYAFYGKEVTGFALDVWWTALKGYDLAGIKDAFNRHLMNPDAGAFLPKPADIVRMLGGTTQDAALQAWAKVDKAVRCVGTYADVVFDDPLIHGVIHDMGGWIAFGSKTEEDWPFIAREFENRFRGYRTRGARPDYPAVLIGMANAHNRKGGFKEEPPRLIGDQQKCLQVMECGTDTPTLGLIKVAQQNLPLRIEDRNTDAA